MHRDPGAVVVPRHQLELALPLRRSKVHRPRDPHPLPRLSGWMVPLAATTHGRRLSRTGSQWGQLILPGRDSTPVWLQVSEGDSAGVAVFQHTPGRRDERVCPYGRGCVRGGERELAENGCRELAGSVPPACPSLGEPGRRCLPCVPGADGTVRGAGAAGPQLHSGAGVEPTASGSVRREGPAALSLSAAGRDRRGPRRRAEPDAWRLRRG